MTAGLLSWTISGTMLMAMLAGTSAQAARPDASATSAGWPVFHDVGLGFTFAYPPGWTVMLGCHSSRRCIALFEGRRGVGDYALALEIFVGGLERTAGEKSVFRHVSNGWVAEGGFASHPAEPIEGADWHGLQAIVDFGVAGRHGMHSAAGECLWAVLSNGRTSVVADTQGTRPIGEDLRRVIQSVRFEEQ